MRAIRYQTEDLGAAYQVEAIPAELQPAAAAAREKLVEAACEADDALLEHYLAGEGLSDDQVTRGIRKGTLALKFVPVVCGSAFKNKGVQPLLDAVIAYLPSPLDVPPVQGHLPGASAEDPAAVVVRKTADDEPFAALIFKIMNDAYVGQLSFFRVYSGRMATGDHVLNVTRQAKHRVGRLLKMHANKREEIKEVYSGDIAAAVGLKQVATGDTICDASHPVILEAMQFPEPVIGWPSSPRPRPIRKSWASASPSSCRRIRPSRCIPTRTPARR
jgi:elongation factor G